MTGTATPRGYVKPGDLATMSINGDSYVVVVKKVTPSGKTIVVKSCVREDGEWIENTHSEDRAFRWNEKRQGFIWSQYFRLTLGVVRDHLDPSF